MKQESLLLVDDDCHLLESMTEWLRDQGFYVDAVLGCADALAQLKNQYLQLNVG